jgi:hypothetical protein
VLLRFKLRRPLYKLDIKVPVDCPVHDRASAPKPELFCRA